MLRFQLTFLSVTDEGLFEPDVLAARHSKEAGSLAAWKDKCRAFSGIADIHDWMHQTHQCYATSRQDEFDVVTITDPKLLASY